MRNTKDSLLLVLHVCVHVAMHMIDVHNPFDVKSMHVDIYMYVPMHHV